LNAACLRGDARSPERVTRAGLLAVACASSGVGSADAVE
jgi:hypothetical protein